MEKPDNDNMGTEDRPDQEQNTLLYSQEQQLEHIRQMRLRLRGKIRDFMEEETGVAYQLEDDLNHILNQEFTQEQQQNVFAKIALLQQFPSQLNTDNEQ